MSNASLGLPSTVLVERTMPKKTFYEHLNVNAQVKRELTYDVEHIVMLASIKEASIHVPTTKEVEEIDVLELQLRENEEGKAAVPYDAIELIARSIPNKLLFSCVHGDSCKLLARLDKLYETEWAPRDEVSLELCGSTLAKLWDCLCSQVVFGDANPVDFTIRLSRANELAALRAQRDKLQKRRGVEKQIGKRNKLWDQIKDIDKRIEELEAQ